LAAPDGGDQVHGGEGDHRPTEADIAQYLFTVSGLHVLHLGKALGKGFDLPGVDLMAFAEREKEIILISCTIDNKLSQKIEPLLSQLNTVRKMPDWSVKGAIFAPIDRGDVTLGSFSDATETDISILLLRLEIQEILSIVKGASADASARTLEVLKQRRLPAYGRK